MLVWGHYTLSLEPSEGLTGASRASERAFNSGMRCAICMMIVSVRSTSLDLPRLGLYATSRRRSSRFPRGRSPYTKMIGAASPNLKLPTTAITRNTTATSLPP